MLRQLIQFNRVPEERTSQLRPGFHGTAQDYTKSMRGTADLMLKYYNGEKISSWNGSLKE